MRLSDLIDQLTDIYEMDGDRDVYVGHQRSWPLCLDVQGVLGPDDTHDDTDPRDPADDPVWIVTDGHPDNHSPYAPDYLWDLVTT